MWFKNFFSGLFIAYGIVIASYLLSTAYENTRPQTSEITVEGYTDRDIIADLAEWKIELYQDGASLQELVESFPMQVSLVREALEEKGYKKEEFIFTSPLKVQELQSSTSVGIENYRVSSYILIRSTQVQKIYKDQEVLNELRQAGLMVSESSLPIFQYTKEKELKPELFNEVIVQARYIAENMLLQENKKIERLKNSGVGTFVFKTQSGDVVDHLRSPTPYLKVKLISPITYTIRE